MRVAVPGVYAITCMVSGKAYIGSTSNPIHLRWRTHKCDLRAGKAHNTHLQSAWDKYGEEAFEFSILENIDCPSLMFEHEQAWIDMARMDGITLYNQNLVVEIPYWLGRTHTAETRQKISVAHTDRVHTEKSRQNMSQALLGNTHRQGQKRSAGEIAKASASLRRAWAEGGIIRSTTRLKAAWIPLIRYLYQHGIMQKDMAEICGVCHVTIGDVCRGRTWRYI